MRRFLASRPSPAMAVAFVALLAALSGTAIALPGTNSVDSGDIVNNTVRGKDIRNGTVGGKDVKNGSVKSADVGDNSLTGTDIDESTLGQVPSANSANTANSANSANTANSANSATNAGNADKLDGQDSSDFVPNTTDNGAALAGVNASAAGAVRSWFNDFGGEPSINKLGVGQYVITFPGLEGNLFFDEVVHQATLDGPASDPGEITVSSSGGNPFVRTFDSAGAAADRAFNYAVFGTNVAP